MSARIHRPGPPLADFVACLWHWDAYAAPAPRERALPTGGLDIVINLAEDRLRVYTGEACETLPGAMMCGAHPDSFVIGTAANASVMGVHFRPGGAFPFLRVPAGDLEGAIASLDAIWGSEASAMRERLLGAPGASERFAIVEHALIQRMRTARRSSTVQLALRAFEDPRLESVAAVERASGASKKKLLASFRDEVGLTPKAYWRVRRFQAALRQVDRGRDGAAIAAEVGYFDQPHFNREFKRFTGMSPTAYLANEHVRPSHVPLR